MSTCALPLIDKQKGARLHRRFLMRFALRF